jgi:hypothetical protein
MRNILKICLFFYLINIVSYTTSAQDNSIAKDSVLLENLTQGIEAFLQILIIINNVLLKLKF